MVSVCNSLKFTDKMDVTKFNDLQNNLNLTLHCKSHDDDLGMHVLLPYATNYHIHFRKNWFGVTLFNWNGGFQWFD